MNFLLTATLYAALALGANPVFAQTVDLAKIAAMRTGDMQKLVIHSKPKKMTATVFWDRDGNEISLSDYKGKTLLVNFWATWCTPCLKEMPDLSALQAKLGGDTFEVLTIAVGNKNPLPVIEHFFKKTKITNLPTLVDPKQKFSRPNGVFGLPVTLIVDANQNELARLTGPADWASPEAVEIIRAFLPVAETPASQ